MKVRCPICRSWVVWESTPTRPFCSAHCKNADLGQWATEAYRVPQEEGEASESSEPPSTKGQTDEES